jgi:putative transposase
MIDRSHDLPLVRQAELLRLSRSTLYYEPQYYEPQSVLAAELAIMRRIDELHPRVLERLSGLDGTKRRQHVLPRGWLPPFPWQRRDCPEEAASILVTRSVSARRDGAATARLP